MCTYYEYISREQRYEFYLRVPYPNRTNDHDSNASGGRPVYIPLVCEYLWQHMLKTCSSGHVTIHVNKKPHQNYEVPCGK